MSCSNGVSTGMVNQHLGWEAVGSSSPLDIEHRKGEGDGWREPCPSASRFYLPKDPAAHKIYGTEDIYASLRIRLATQAARGLAAFGDRVAFSRAREGVASQAHGRRLGRMET